MIVFINMGENILGKYDKIWNGGHTNNFQRKMSQK